MQCEGDFSFLDLRDDTAELVERLRAHTGEAQSAVSVSLALIEDSRRSLASAGAAIRSADVDVGSPVFDGEIAVAMP